MIKNLSYVLLLFFGISLFQSKNLAGYEKSASFFPPVNITVSATHTSGEVNWDPVSGATSYSLRFRPVGPYAWSTATSIPVNTYTISSLQPCTAYEVQVMDNVTNTFSASVIFTTFLNYCTSGSTDSSLAHISNVTVTPSVGTQMVSNSGISFYTDYRNDIARRIYLAIGSTNNVLSVTRTVTGAQAVPTSVSAWIDYNANGIFEDSEKIMNSAPNAVSPSLSSFAVPVFATIGNCGVSMRVMISSSTNISPCGVYTYGETEDYGVYFTNANLSVTDSETADKLNIYPNPATDVLNISGISSATDYEIYSASGQKVGNGKVSDYKIDLRHLIKGVYFIQLKDKENITKLKFIKK